MKARRPNRLAVEWLESRANPTWWERGSRPDSVHTQPLLMIKEDENADCGAVVDDFCFCIPSLPEVVLSVEYTEHDERIWLEKRRFPRTLPRYQEAREQHKADWMKRAETYGPAVLEWREAKRQQRVVVQRDKSGDGGAGASGPAPLR